MGHVSPNLSNAMSRMRLQYPSRRHDARQGATRGMSVRLKQAVEREI